MRTIFVADTDEEARRVAEGPLNHLFRLFIPHAVPKDLNTLPADYAYYKEFFRPFVGATMSYDDVINNGILVVGSPKTVTRMLNEQIEETGTGHFLCWMNFGSLTQQQVLRSEELFAKEVIPQLRGLNNGIQEQAA
jgi:alkanesulfonate monooxygenase SsuD/methylene tetrahydromethanopterin reductase-like flavin-dependent oxidoreductase (luciferase family)